MSGGAVCKCGEHKVAIALRQWQVVHYRCNYSAFNGYQYTPSDYSEIQCTKCLSRWRTNRPYADTLYYQQAR